MSAAPMPARWHAWAEGLLLQPETLAQMARVVGDTFHVLDPATFADNLAAFSAAFDDCGVDGRIRYGYKANKARAFVRECASAASAARGRFGVDVASVEEFGAALTAGVRGEEIVVTGPAHGDEMLRLAARHDAVVAIDSLESVRRLCARPPAEDLGILLRLRPPGATTRFGLTDGQVRVALSELRDCKRIVLRGMSFHLSGYDIAPRAAMAHHAIDLCLAARDCGHRPEMISLGGGFAVDYLDRRHWDAYCTEEVAQWYFDGNAPASLYPYAPDVAGAEMLSAVLGTSRSQRGPGDHSGSVAQRVRDLSLRIMVEPGRALCDGAGFSVFTVRGIHHTPDGTAVVTVSGTSLSLSEQWFGSEFLPDPRLIDLDDVTAPHGHTTETMSAVVAGSTCLDGDLLSRRRIRFPRRAKVGDLLVYPNTAGYQMDSNESEFHQTPLPPKLVVRQRDTTTTWSIDR
ncbi:alanine racemase [Gordonia polyisoprenivorans]|uniref:alanine racemase n=1 Tax=Gordonia polyisoprenivorans TaxID=84595 RepID=UPI0023006840|nr:alanine racemase [Gordonia polyisoprenivorans]WCB36911.1 alanine racemase [Gordonia polyisoprenivorans]